MAPVNVAINGFGRIGRCDVCSDARCRRRCSENRRHTYVARVAPRSPADVGVAFARALLNLSLLLLLGAQA